MYLKYMIGVYVLGGQTKKTYFCHDEIRLKSFLSTKWQFVTLQNCPKQFKCLGNRKDVYIRVCLFMKTTKHWVRTVGTCIVLDWQYSYSFLISFGKVIQPGRCRLWKLAVWLLLEAAGCFEMKHCQWSGEVCEERTWRTSSSVSLRF